MMNINLRKMQENMEIHSITPATQESYLRRVKTFLAHVNIPDDSLTLMDIRNYILFLKQDKKLSLGTINAYLSAIKFYFYTTLGNEWESKIVPRMRGYESIPVVLSTEEVTLILNSVHNLKHKAILLLLYGSGMRVSEVVKLKVADIDSKNMQIFIDKPKNKCARYAMLSESALLVLRKYWKSFGRPTDWLFPGSNPQEHLNVKTVKNVMLKTKLRLSFTKKISAHTLRHCFATHLLEKNVALSHIQHLLGHKSLTTTSKYLHMTSKAMMNIESPLDSLNLEDPDK